jgi:hypothetical protein
MPTDLEFEVKYALSTAYLCPANVFGRKPSSGSNVYSRAVMSLDVVMKQLTFSRQSVRLAKGRYLHVPRVR